MKVFDKVMSVFLMIGLIMLAGRIVTGICRYFDWPFTTFFTDYHLISLVILVIGIIGIESRNYQKKKRRK